MVTSMTSGLLPPSWSRRPPPKIMAHCAIVAVEHDINFVRALDTDTLVLHQGRFFRRGPFAEIEADDAVRDVYLGRR